MAMNATASVLSDNLSALKGHTEGLIVQARLRAYTSAVRLHFDFLREPQLIGTSSADKNTACLRLMRNDRDLCDPALQ